MGEPKIVLPPSDLPPDLFLDFETAENGVVEEEEEVAGGGGERERAASPQFSTTSTVSGGLDSTNNLLLSESKDSLDRDDNRADDQIIVTTTPGKGETVVATTTNTWERFEPAPSKSSWETFEPSSEGVVKGTESHSQPQVNGTAAETGPASDGATAPSPIPKLGVQSEDGTGAVCAADALVSTGWTALGGGIGPRVDEVEDDDNLPFRQTRSMRATTNRKVQIVDALKQQRRLSNTSLDRDPTRGGGPFANEDELSRRYNTEREWQVFVKMSKRVPGTR